MKQQIDLGRSICDDKTLALPRVNDSQGFYIHCVGGFRAALSEKDAWIIEPVVDHGRPCRKGFFTKAELNAFLTRTELAPIAFQSFGWHRGNYHSSWSPLILGRTNHSQGPSDLWGRVASTLGKERRSAAFNDMATPTRERIAQIVDQRTEEEWLARAISLSLRSIDISVQHVAEFYFEQLVDLTADGCIAGQRRASTLDQTLFAYVHSFFLHLGAARDYLASLIALRIGQDPHRIDSMARLVGLLRSKHSETDALVNLLESRRFIRPKPSAPDKREISGWLEEVSELRNQFVHRRPYGARHAETFGHIAAIDPQIGLYRYVRPMLLKNDVEHDALDVIVSNYKQATTLFQDAAEASGQDTSMLTLTDKDIVQIEGTTL